MHSDQAQASDRRRPQTEPMSTDNDETDTATDEHLAGSRATGGLDDQHDDQASTTGTTETPEFVGRVAGDDVGYAGETGAERRAEG